MIHVSKKLNLLITDPHYWSITFSLTVVKPKIPPSTLPKPNLSNWQQQNQSGLNKTITSTTTQFKQQSTPGPGQSSFTGSIPAPRRGRGQLRNQELGSRIPICANLGCCQQIR